jgi:hypothetical protein
MQLAVAQGRFFHCMPPNKTVACPFGCEFDTGTWVFFFTQINSGIQQWHGHGQQCHSAKGQKLLRLLACGVDLGLVRFHGIGSGRN